MSELNPRWLEFIEWLHDNDYLEDYMTNYGHCNPAATAVWDAPAQQYINYHAEWSETPEGHQAWGGRETKWEKYLREHPLKLDWQGILNAFLIEQGCYKEYWTAIDNLHDGDTFESDVEDLIDGHFSWESTKEGKHSWSEVNTAWLKKANEISYKYKENLNRVEIQLDIPSDYFLPSLADGDTSLEIPEPVMPSNYEVR